MRQYIYGKNMVIDALKGDREVYKLYLLKSVADDKLIHICQDRKIDYEITNKQRLYDLVGQVSHQGMVASVKGYDYVSLDALYSSPKDKEPMLLMLDGLEDPQNLGAILRTCDAIGVDGVIIPKNRSVGLTATVAKISTGAIDYVKVAQVTNLARTLADLKKKGFWIVGCDMNESQDYREVDYNMPVVIVIGSEGFGISRLVKQQCDINVSLPMVGHVNSLNASVAAALIVYEVYNSRHPLS